MFTSITILFFVFIIIYLYLRYKLTFWRRQGVPQHVLHSFKLFRNVMPYTDMQLIQQKGKVVGTYELIWPNLLVAEPSLITQILIRKFPHFPDHRTLTQPEQNLGKGLPLLSYKEWKPARAIMTQAFKPNNIKLMHPIIDEEIKILLNKLDQVADDGFPINIKPYFEAFTTGVVIRAFFGIRISISDEQNLPVVDFAKRMLGSNISLSQMFAIFAPNAAKIFGCHALNAEATEYLTNFLNQIIKCRRERNSMECDFIKYLLDAGKNNNDDNLTNKRFSDKEVVDNCMFFYLAATETTTAGFANLVYFLATNPEIQEKVYEEVNQTDINIETINKLVYLEACIHETLRFYPALPRIERKAINDTLLEGVFIPRNTFVSIPAHAVHHDPDNYDEPERFMPERFLPENKHKIKPGTYLGFADGPRNCIGMRFALTNMRLCMAKVLQKYIFVACDETRPPEFCCGNPTVSPKSTFVKITRRYN